MIRPPRIFTPGAKELADEVRARTRDYTPSWTHHRRSDPGEVLIDLFAGQAALVAGELNRLPEKAGVELARTAGVTPLAPRPARALVTFEVSPSAPAAATIPRGFQISGRDGDGALIVFETERDLMAAPVTIAGLQLREGDLFATMAVPAPRDPGSLLPFGARPAPGSALYIGFAGPIAPAPRLAVGVFLAPLDGLPPPVSAGGVTPSLPPAPPVLSWDVFDGTQFVRAEVLRDDTASFMRSGVVELRVPRRWQPSTPPGMADGEPLRWLRARLLFGRWAEPPRVWFLVPNVVPALAGETLRNEVLEPRDPPGGRGRVMALRKPPRNDEDTSVVADSLVLNIDDGTGEAEWEEVDDFAPYSGDARVYVLDPSEGLVSFGDGVHGRPLPEGFRHVRAVSYRIISPIAKMEFESIDTLVSSAPFVKGVTNPLAPSGGTERESLRDAVARAPRELAARGRAVTPADYELLALRAPGADVRRACAVPTFHPGLGGRPIPGVVGVLVVPADPQDGKPPIPDEGSLRGVAEFLTAEAAPAGVEVVAAAPRYVTVRAEMAAEVDPRMDGGQVVQKVIEELDLYFHPLRGGEDGRGWPFGGAIRYVPLIRRLLERCAGLTAVPRLNLVIDGVRSLGCEDRPIPRLALLWPDGHEILPLRPGEVES